MALSHAILVSLLDRPRSGYELGKRFEKTLGFFWKASHQQIYQQLHKMSDSGWVQGQTVEQSERPNRIVYDITQAGRDVVDEWVATPSDPPSVKEELLVKLYALGDVDRATLVAELRRRLAFHQDRLVLYQAIMEEYYADLAALTDRQQGRYLGLRLGILSEEASIKWAGEAVALVAGRA